VTRKVIRLPSRAVVRCAELPIRVSPLTERPKKESEPSEQSKKTLELVKRARSYLFFCQQKLHMLKPGGLKWKDLTW